METLLVTSSHRAAEPREGGGIARFWIADPKVNTSIPTIVFVLKVRVVTIQTVVLPKVNTAYQYSNHSVEGKHQYPNHSVRAESESGDYTDRCSCSI